MIKSNLPVILLKGLVLLPQGDARIELNNDVSLKVIDIAKLYHNNEVLIVTPLNDLEESPDTSDLPKTGVVARVTSRIDLPNGKTRIVLKGVKRIRVLSYVNYSNEKDILESVVTNVEEIKYDEINETALLRKLMSELDKYISINPYISNSILSQVKGIVELDKLTDYIANFLPLSFGKKLSLMLDVNRVSRAKKLITEINIELAVLELEGKIELDLKRNIDELQKEMILREKIKVIKAELGEEDGKSLYVREVSEKLKDIALPPHIDKRVRAEVKRYELMPDNSPEIGVIRTYIDYLLEIPWGVKTEDETDIVSIQEKLDLRHYGLNDVKERILEYVGVKTIKEDVTSPIICLVGPPGVGKTTLAKSIADALGKKFAKVSLGGINDPAELIGHRKTYIGSAPGKIVNAFIKAGSENSLILLDEVDKLSKDYKGDPVSALLDLLDRSGNCEFVDQYIEEPIDLSQVTFVLTANDKSLIPYVLLDRLELIELPSYMDYEKVHISKDYIIPECLSRCGLNNVIFTDEAILKIINEYTKESGVRELGRLIDKIVRKIIIKSNKNNNYGGVVIKGDDLKDYLGFPKYVKSSSGINRFGYSRGLAYTPYGGEVLEIEVTSYSGKEEFITSGNLGEVIEESVKVALSYIKANVAKFGIKESDLKKTIHLNFREGGLPKDGPSAGTIITTTILSYLLKKKIPGNVSMTGEITLLGDVLPIGGLREKSIAALKDGINKIYVSRKNKRDIDLIDDEIKCKIDYIFVDNYMEIYRSIFERRDLNGKGKTN